MTAVNVVYVGACAALFASGWLRLLLVDKTSTRPLVRHTFALLTSSALISGVATVAGWHTADWYDVGPMLSMSAVQIVAWRLWRGSVPEPYRTRSFRTAR